MIKVYTYIDNKLASFEVETENYADATSAVKAELGSAHTKPVLALA